MSIFKSKFFWIAVIGWALFTVALDSANKQSAQLEKAKTEAFVKEMERLRLAEEQRKLEQSQQVETQIQNQPVYYQPPAQTFGDYPCTQDCSGHQAGYDWAKDKDISSTDDCGGNSQSFIEGCYEYVNEYYPDPDNCENYNVEEEVCED